MPATGHRKGRSKGHMNVHISFVPAEAERWSHLDKSVFAHFKHPFCWHKMVCLKQFKNLLSILNLFWKKASFLQRMHGYRMCFIYSCCYVSRLLIIIQPEEGHERENNVSGLIIRLVIWISRGVWVLSKQLSGAPPMGSNAAVHCMSGSCH